MQNVIMLHYALANQRFLRSVLNTVPKNWRALPIFLARLNGVLGFCLPHHYQA